MVGIFGRYAGGSKTIGALDERAAAVDAEDNPTSDLDRVAKRTDLVASTQLEPIRASAATAPTGTCIDGDFFDGLDSRFGASYCANALNAAGYEATAYSNT